MALLPSTKKPRGATLRSITPAFVAQPHVGARQVQEYGLQRWAVDYDWPPLTRAQADELFAFLVALRGQALACQIVIPDKALARGWGGDKVLTGPTVTWSLGRQATTSGWTPSTTGVLLPGDLVKFSGHSKVYMVSAAVNSDVSGNALINFEPALQATVANGETVAVDAVQMNVALTSDIAEISADTAIRYGLTASFLEVA